MGITKQRQIELLQSEIDELKKELIHKDQIITEIQAKNDQDKLDAEELAYRNFVNSNGKFIKKYIQENPDIIHDNIVENIKKLTIEAEHGSYLCDESDYIFITLYLNGERISETYFYNAD